MTSVRTVVRTEEPADWTCWLNLLTEPADWTCWLNLLTEPADWTCWLNLLTEPEEPVMKTVKDKRREVRLSDADENTLVEAAGLAGVSVSEFLLERALHDAEEIVRAHHVIELNERARREFLAMLDSPLPTDEALADQVRRANRLKHIDWPISKDSAMRIERLNPRHDLAAFDSGEKTLDDWLRNHAMSNQERNLSRTYVLLDDADTVLGYYSLTMAGVAASELPKQLGRGLPPIDIGAVLLARLAVHIAVQGTGLGRDLLVDAIRTSIHAGTAVAARFIAVDPLNEAARTFYQAFGFRDIPGDDRSRMFLRLDVAAQSLLDGAE
jgi:uncharacterized protein (DUF1778 family)/GNAT superfamily N-acetyltransferase